MTLAPAPVVTTPRKSVRAAGKTAFTLIELLVVISIIALLIGILLPALGAARKSARNLACLSNIRQVTIAANTFAADHKGYMQSSTTDFVFNGQPVDPRVARAQDRYKGDNATPDRLADWATAISRYMGEGSFDTDDTDTTEGFLCPDDPSRSYDDPGYRVYNNISANEIGRFQPISYGINADVTAAVGAVGGQKRGFWDGTSWIRPYNEGGSVLDAKPVQGLLEAVRDGSSTHLFSDLCTRDPDPNVGDSPAQDASQRVDDRDTLVISSSASRGVGGTLGDYYREGNVEKLPISEVPGGERHPSDAINVAFVDGHASSAVGESGWDEVKISPLY